ncbi:UDP-N-acetylmuramoyl-L-alanine--D-glutamate ligase, partial [bacterium]|nr:UDP-N-acetylmuramoyl-L-alanine--D-glutamate ligase [bacterium]
MDVSRVAVLGTGVTGTAVVETLARFGVEPVSVDQADWVVVSPGIPPKDYPATSARIVSEIEFAFRWMASLSAAPVLIGVTGTNGKSTITAMIAHILNIPFAGNIGVPLVSYVGQPIPMIVVELSSYQLEQCMEFRPEVAVITRITPDHLERHGTMANYAAAKGRICASQKESDHVIFPSDDALVLGLVSRSRAVRHPVSDNDELVNRIALKARIWEMEGIGYGVIGAHNHINAAMAVKAAVCLGMGESEAIERLKTYQPLPHRMEWVANWEGRRFFDDSKATNPESTMVAVDAFSDPIHLILGGKDKHLELRDFLTFLFSRVATICVYGEIGDRLMALATEMGCPVP